jgi:hypothetical protein
MQFAAISHYTLSEKCPSPSLNLHPSPRKKVLSENNSEYYLKRRSKALLKKTKGRFCARKSS